MKGKIFWFVFSCLISFSVILFSSCKKGPIASMPETTKPSSTGANWWDKMGTPTYGGTISIRMSNLDVVGLDPLTPAMGGGQGVYERLFGQSWTTDRDVFAFKGMYIPTEYMQGWLAERWEQTDATTVIVHLRKGVHWSNKPPTNGREFTADDIVFNYDRISGTGSGFTKPNPMLGSMIAYIKKATAIDKYTVQFKFKTASAFALYDIFAPQVNIVSPEWVKKYGSNSFTMPGPPGGGPGGPGGPGGGPGGPGGSPMQDVDWHTYASTCPYMITNFVRSSTLTYSKVPDYYGYDERYPQNRLPYIDTINYIAIPDLSTAIAALRTGKIDIIESGRGAGLTLQHVKNINQSNPEINTWWCPTDGPTIPLRVDKSPFTDLRVRQALQMAIDRKTIASSYFGGMIDGVPCGLISPLQTGWCTPYAKWPDDLKQLYSYNPARAKQLLSEAGYPNGFKTNIIAATDSDMQLLQILKSQYRNIAVDITVKAMDYFPKREYVGAGNHDQMEFDAFTGGAPNPWQQITVLTKGDRQNYTYNNDEKYDAMYKKIKGATSEAKAKKLINEADQYALQQCWMIFLFPINVPTVSQPYVKGYMGEGNATGNTYYLSRWWIDQDLKKSTKR